MNLRLLCVAHGVAAMLCAAPCRAQQTTAEAASGTPDGGLERVFVRVVDSNREIRGRLLRLDSQTLSIRVDNRTLDLPLERVLRVEKKIRDSLLNGAIFGALYVAACAIWWCGQGLDDPTSLPADAILGAGMGALVGAGIDALFYRRATIFQAGGSTTWQPMRPSVAVSFRF